MRASSAISVLPRRSTVLVEPTGLDAAQRLTLHELAQKLDHGQNERRQPTLDVLGVGFDTVGQDVVETPQVTGERIEVDRCVEQLVRG